MRLFAAPDLKAAVRGLIAAPTVSLSAIVCLGLGIGATTAIASAINRALLTQLPFRAPDRLVAAHRTTPQSGPQGTWPMSAPNYTDLAAASRQIASLAAISENASLVTLADQAVLATNGAVTGNLFPMLGARATLGRLIVPDDDRLDRPPVVVLGNEFWRGKLGADPRILGASLIIDGQAATIIGVAPVDFRIPFGYGLVIRKDIWTPMRFTPNQLAQRRTNYLHVIGRLADGATPASAQAELRANFAGLVAQFPPLKGENVRVAALEAENVQNLRQPLVELFVAVCMVLLIAATNVAALLLARGVRRSRETAVRTALGATRWDVMRGPLAESLVLALTGALLGVAIAVAGIRTIGTLASARLPQLSGLTIDWRVIAFALGLTMVVTVGCGMLPAWRAGAVNPNDALRGGRGGGAGREQSRTLRGLVVVEIALSLVLLIGAGLVLKAFSTLLGNDPGFDASRVLTLNVNVSPVRYQQSSTVRGFLEPALEAIRALPGVQGAGAISSIPYISWGNNSNIRYEAAELKDPTQYPIVEQRSVTTGFFAMTGQRLVAGRLLEPTDDENAPPVAVVNEALAQRDFGGANPVGKRFYVSDTSFGTIVGMVSDIRNAGPVSPAAPEMYWTYRMTSANATYLPIMVRTAGDPAAMGPAVRAAIRQVDPSAAIAWMRPMREVIVGSLGEPRFYMSLLGAFAGVAMVLAVAGLYGVLSYAVAQRTRELGIRLALGSPKARLMRLVTRQGAELIGGGIALGLLAGAGVTRFLAFVLYGVSPLDASTYVWASLALGLVGLAATAVPAWRATRVNPVEAIQAE